jgi:hypothetical protein
MTIQQNQKADRAPSIFCKNSSAGVAQFIDIRDIGLRETIGMPVLELALNSCCGRSFEEYGLES